MRRDPLRIKLEATLKQKRLQLSNAREHYDSLTHQCRVIQQAIAILDQGTEQEFDK